MLLRFRDDSRVNVIIDNEAILPKAITELFHPILGQCLVTCPRDVMTSKQKKVGLVEMGLRVNLFQEPPFNPGRGKALTDEETFFQFGEVSDGFDAVLDSCSWIGENS